MMVTNAVHHPYLQGGGEMGELTRSYDWEQTPIGSFDKWPQSLRTTVSIILRSDFPMFLWWGEEMIQFYNDAYRPSLGNEGKHPKALGQRGKECWPEIWDIIYPLIEQVRKTGKSFFSEDQLVPIYRNGQIEDVYWTFSYSAVIGEQGTTDGILVVCQETTRQVLRKLDSIRIRKQLELSEANLRNLILQSPVAMCLVMGKSLIIEMANEKVLEIWGKDQSVIGKPVFEALPEARAQGLEVLLEKVLTTGEHFVAHERPVNLASKGKIQTKYLNFVYEPFRDGEGRIAGIMAVAIDVTEQVLARRKIEEVVTERTRELAESNTNLQRSNQELGQFAYIASHDLQEPARKIRTFAEMLRKSLGKIDERPESYLTKIDTSASRMLMLIRDVLAFSQLKTRQEFVKIDLNEILEIVKSDFELLIEEKNAVINSAPLPTIEGSPVQIIQLFGNLLSNSLKFSSRDQQPEISISVTELNQMQIRNNKSLNPGQAYYKISFKDNGIGFGQENATQIFDIFQRLHARNEYQGTGIGLAMCRKITQNHGGSIYAEASLGKGATFHVIFPKSMHVDKQPVLLDGRGAPLS